MSKTTNAKLCGSTPFARGTMFNRFDVYWEDVSLFPVAGRCVNFCAPSIVHWTNKLVLGFHEQSSIHSLADGMETIRIASGLNRQRAEEEALVRQRGYGTLAAYIFLSLALLAWRRES